MNRLKLKYLNRNKEQEAKPSSKKKWTNRSTKEIESEGAMPNFYEYYVDGVPLSRQLDEFYNTEKPLLDYWVGLLGSFPNKEVERVKVKQLLLKEVTEKDIRKLYPKDMNPKLVSNYLKGYRDILDAEEVLIYGCAECGDYYCGGIGVRIEKNTGSFIWTFNNEEEVLSFRFNIYEYYEIFQKYLEGLKN